MTVYEPKLKPGAIIVQNPNSILNGGTYWKVRYISHTGYMGQVPSYSCIRCSKTGKEFKDTNGFTCDWVDREITKSTQWKLQSEGSDLGIKANIKEGNKIGAKKRRITYLRERIAADTLALASLLKELNMEEVR